MCYYTNTVQVHQLRVLQCYPKLEVEAFLQFLAVTSYTDHPTHPPAWTTSKVSLKLQNYQKFQKHLLHKKIYAAQIAQDFWTYFARVAFREGIAVSLTSTIQNVNMCDQSNMFEGKMLRCKWITFDNCRVVISLVLNSTLAISIFTSTSELDTSRFGFHTGSMSMTMVLTINHNDDIRSLSLWLWQFRRIDDGQWHSFHTERSKQWGKVEKH